MRSLPRKRKNSCRTTRSNRHSRVTSASGEFAQRSWRYAHSLRSLGARRSQARSCARPLGWAFLRGFPFTHECGSARRYVANPD